MIPEMINGFEAFIGSAGEERQLGLVDADLPAIEHMTAEISGAGLAGKFNAPVLGHTEPMELVLRFRSITPSWVGMLISTQQLVTLKGNLQGLDPATGLHANQALTILATGLVKAKRPGRMAVGETMGAELVVEALRYNVLIDGVPVVLIDKLNYVYEVMGSDALSGIKNNLGLGGFGETSV